MTDPGKAAFGAVLAVMMLLVLYYAGIYLPAVNALSRFTYTNTMLGFQLVFPAGWDAPGINESAPRAFDCLIDRCRKGLQVRRDDSYIGRGFESVMATTGGEDRSDLVKDARVIKSGAPTNQDGWTLRYIIIFEDFGKSFVVFTNHQSLERTILPTFAPVKERK